MNALLTIAIPTFNRNEVLSANLRKLLPQMDDRVCLRILDNSSVTPVADTLAPLLAEFPAADVKIIRHAANVGMSANILRCFELCSTEWIWVLGDDDSVYDNACDLILRRLGQSPPTVALAFRSELLPVDREMVIDDLGDFFERDRLFTGMIFLSSSVYRVASLRAGLGEAHEYCGTFAPHSALLLLAFPANPGPRIRCVTDRIVTWRAAEAAERYSMFYAFKLAGLLPLVNGPAASACRRSVLSLMAPTRRLFLHAIRDLNDGGCPYEIRAFFHRYLAVSAELKGGVVASVQAISWFLVFAVFSRCPRKTFLVLSAVYAALRRKPLRDALQANRIGRNIMNRLAETTSHETAPSIS